MGVVEILRALKKHPVFFYLLTEVYFQGTVRSYAYSDVERSNSRYTVDISIGYYA